MMDDLSKTIKAQLYERASSPLLASFCLAWVAWNYKFLLIVVSSMPSAEKLELIERVAFPTDASVWLNGVTFPLLSALALIFLYPFPAKYIYEYSRKRQHELKEIQQRIDDETPLTRDEAKQIRREAMQSSLEFEREIDSRRTEVQRLKDLVASLQTELEKATTSPRGSATDTNLADELTPVEVRASPTIVPRVPGRIGGVPPKLTEEAKTLLIEASLDKSGTILIGNTVTGTKFQANGKSFGGEGDRRTLARWEHGLEQLVTYGLVNARGTKGETFVLTEAGYGVAEANAISPIS